MADDRRTVMIWARVTPPERAVIEAAARARDVSLSDVVRGALVAHARQILRTGK